MVEESVSQEFRRLPYAGGKAASEMSLFYQQWMFSWQCGRQRKQGCGD